MFRFSIYRTAAVKKPSETSNNDASALANKLKGWAADSKSQITVQQPKFTLAKVTDKKGQLCEKVRCEACAPAFNYSICDEAYIVAYSTGCDLTCV